MATLPHPLQGFLFIALEMHSLCAVRFRWGSRRGWTDLGEGGEARLLLGALPPQAAPCPHSRLFPLLPPLQPQQTHPILCSKASHPVPPGPLHVPSPPEDAFTLPAVTRRVLGLRPRVARVDTSLLFVPYRGWSGSHYPFICWCSWVVSAVLPITGGVPCTCVGRLSCGRTPGCGVAGLPGKSGFNLVNNLQTPPPQLPPFPSRAPCMRPRIPILDGTCSRMSAQLWVSWGTRCLPGGLHPADDVESSSRARWLFVHLPWTCLFRAFARSSFGWFFFLLLNPKRPLRVIETGPFPGL